MNKSPIDNKRMYRMTNFTVALALSAVTLLAACGPSETVTSTTTERTITQQPASGTSPGTTINTTKTERVGP